MRWIRSRTFWRRMLIFVSILVGVGLAVDRWANGPWPLETIRTWPELVYGVAFTDDGKAIVANGYQWSILLDLASKTAVPAEGGSRRDDRVSRDGSLHVIIDKNKDNWRATRLLVVEAATGRERLSFEPHPDQLNAAAVSPDGRFVATAGGSTSHPWPVNPAGDARLWDARTGRLLVTLRRHWGAVSSVAFSPDGETLATGSYDGTIKLWRCRDLVGP